LEIPYRLSSEGMLSEIKILKSLLIQIYMLSNLYVQFGCGSLVADGWLNYDSSPTLRLERLPLIGKMLSRKFPDSAKYGDIVKGLPLNPSSCAVVYSSHVLEHLSLEDFRRALRNIYRILQNGGLFRFVVPNLSACIKTYLDDEREIAAEEFMRYTGLGVEQRPRGIEGYLRAILGSQRHLWMWDFKAMRLELIEAGFESVRRCAFGDSADRMLRLVENEERYAYDSLAVECLKPLITPLDEYAHSPLSES
jgi:SAM-dependent methyltransferase